MVSCFRQQSQLSEQDRRSGGADQPALVHFTPGKPLLLKANPDNGFLNPAFTGSRYFWLMQEDIIVQISNRLRDIRKEKNITLQELAESAGVTKGLLSQVENSRTIPSLSVLLNLIKGLQVDLNHFFSDINLEPAREKVIFRKKEQYQPFQKESAAGFHYHRIFSTQLNDYHADFVLLRLEKDAQRAMVSTDALEFKYVLEGRVKYVIGDKTYHMEEGDSLFFDGTILHNPYNEGETDALLLIIYLFNQKT